MRLKYDFNKLRHFATKPHPLIRWRGLRISDTVSSKCKKIHDDDDGYK